MPYVSPPHVMARKRRVRSRIIDSAIELFSAQGYECSSIKDIVTHAGTSVGNCYFYFKDKEELLREATRRLCRRTDIKISRLAKRFDDAPSRMAAALWMGSNLMVEHKGLARMLFIEAPKTGARSEVMRFLRRRVELSFTGQKSQFHFRRSPAASLLRDPAFITVAWTGAVWGTFEAVARDELQSAGDELGRKLVDWNLGALGLYQSDIEEIISRIKEVVAADGIDFL